MTCFNDVHSLKAKSSIFFTEEGIITCSNDEHSSKVYSLIIVIEEEIVICFNDLHSLKARFPISVTEEEIKHVWKNRCHVIRKSNSFAFIKNILTYFNIRRLNRN